MHKTTSVKIKSFFSDCKIDIHKNKNKFEKLLIKKHGALAVDFLKCVDARVDNNTCCDPYPIKNTTLEFANDIAAAFDCPRLEPFFQWIINENFTNCRKFLEIGCDNGLISCFLARELKGSSGIGIDRCKEGIDLARRRASDLKVTNIAFLNDTFDSFSKNNKPGSYDMIFASLVYHEVIQPNPCESVAPTSDYFDGISKLLSEDGFFISVDRFQTPKSLIDFSKFAIASGLKLSLAKSFLLNFVDGFKNKERLVLTVLSKSLKGTPLPSDILSFFDYNAFLESPSAKLINSPVVAESIYRSLTRKETICKVSTTYYKDNVTEDIDIFESEGIFVVYVSSEHGDKSLSIFPLVFLPEYLQNIPAMLDERKTIGSVSVWQNNDLSSLKRLNAI
ncbi:class I SAM-dependent methyltransferase [Fundidesulfovibrio soli]|uniref:class I SAM-dependent methyltransferase n=1 Tax=Fundidesulfovibrio soli TaxID=2922716 RepID=UPI001FAEAF22|nr:methyltransferase domain-containing protein [Fundidesulfovibrio soli]